MTHPLLCQLKSKKKYTAWHPLMIYKNILSVTSLTRYVLVRELVAADPLPNSTSGANHQLQQVLQYFNKLESLSVFVHSLHPAMSFQMCAAKLYSQNKFIFHIICTCAERYIAYKSVIEE